MGGSTLGTGAARWAGPFLPLRSLGVLGSCPVSPSLTSPTTPPHPTPAKPLSLMKIDNGGIVSEHPHEVLRASVHTGLFALLITGSPLGGEEAERVLQAGPEKPNTTSPPRVSAPGGGCAPEHTAGSRVSPTDPSSCPRGIHKSQWCLLSPSPLPLSVFSGEGWGCSQIPQFAP